MYHISAEAKAENVDLLAWLMEDAVIDWSEFVGRVSAWIPRLGNLQDEAIVMSRDFWMPDRSCRMCYECESQFTIFNRRHHCRICGKVFCGRCTLNTIAAPVNSPRRGHDENERVRACNYCFKIHTDRSEQDHINREIFTLKSTPSQIVSSSEPAGHSINIASGSGARALAGKHDSVSTCRPFCSDATVVESEMSEDRNPGYALCMDAQPKSRMCIHVQSRPQALRNHQFCRSDVSLDLIFPN